MTDAYLNRSILFFIDDNQLFSEKLVASELSAVVNLWFPLKPGHFPSSLPRDESSHAIAVGDWLIWTLIEWTLFSIFFWCPAKVTPILRRSLGEKKLPSALVLEQLFIDQHTFLKASSW